MVFLLRPEWPTRDYRNWSATGVANISAQAGAAEETIFADIDLAEIGAGLAALDTDGHYSRPDIFELRVNTQMNEGVVFD